VRRLLFIGLGLAMVGCAPLGLPRVLILGSHNQVTLWLIVRQDSHPLELGDVDKSMHTDQPGAKPDER
jgi:hypothetical protein